MNNQVVTINLVPGLSAPAVVRVSQYDVGRPLVFKLLDGTNNATMSGAAADVVGTKPSGLGFSVTGTVVGNTVTLNTTLDMTQESGQIPTEIRFSKSGEDIGTANFILAVEQSPHPEGTTDGTQETMANLETRLQGEINALDSRIDAIEGDETISQQISALDARVTALEQGGGSGLTQTEKELILTLFSKAAYAEDDAGTAYDELEELWTTTTRTITYNLSHVVSSNTATSIENGERYTTTFGVQTNYTLNSAKVTMGGVDITATAYSSGTVTIPSVTGDIVITATAVLAAQSITAVYTQSGTVYDTDSLDSLKADLVVTANYAGGSSETVPASEYTLSGTLTVGTSTITVSYAGLTTTFNVTVTEYSVLPAEYQQVEYIKATGTQHIITDLIVHDVADSDSNSIKLYTVDIDFKFDEWQSAYATNIIAGFGSGSGKWIGYSNAVTQIAMGTSSGQYFTTGTVTDRHQYHYDITGTNDATWKRDDNATITRTVGTAGGTNVNFQLFYVAISSGTQNNFHFNGKLYSCKVYKSGNIVMDLYPCYRKSDDEIGMYDIVNDRFYTNDGTDTFLKGSDV